MNQLQELFDSLLVGLEIALYGHVIGPFLGEVKGLHNQMLELYAPLLFI